MQKGHPAKILVAGGGGGRIPKCLSAKRSQHLNVGY